MKIIQKIHIIKECFPKSWFRKLVFLLFKTNIIKENKKIVAIIITYKNEIVLLGVSKKYRRRGYATKLIKDTKATETYTFASNKIAVKFWKNNGFKIKSRKKTIFGDKYKFVKNR